MGLRIRARRRERLAEQGPCHFESTKMSRLSILRLLLRLSTVSTASRLPPPDSCASNNLVRSNL
jgi:hypothetical protein